MKLLKKTKKIFNKLPVFYLFFLFAFPVSSNYSLRSYDFGGGGGSLDSSNFQLEGILGTQDTASMSSSNYNARGGLIYTQTVNVPAAPSLVNSSNWYNKLLLTISTSSNPTDTKYAVEISNDNWVTTRYVQNDNTIGATLGIEDYQTYVNWGSGSGENIIGLAANTTYWVRVKAMQGEFSETDYGPQASAATSPINLDFDIDTSSADQETGAPYSVGFGNLNAGSVNTASNKIWMDLTTNAEAGGYVYIYSANSGLRSSAVNYTINSSSTNLSSATEGFGLRENSSSGLTFLSPYNVASENVGIVDTSIREILNSGGSAVTSGRASVLVKAKSSSTTPAASDYSDTLTLIASGTF